MSGMDVFDLSAYLQWAGSLLIVVFALLHLKNGKRVIFMVAVYGFTSFVFQLGQEISWLYFNRRYNNIIGNVYFPFEIVTLLCVYYLAVRKQSLRYGIVVLGAVPLLFYFLKINNQFASLNANTETLRDFVMIVCSLGYFFYLIHELPKENVTRMPMFWINTAVLIYFSCTFLLSLSLDYLTGVLKDNLIGYWSFRNFLRVAFCATICFGIWRGRNELSAN